MDSLFPGAGLRHWRQTPCPGQARLPGWWGRAASGDAAGAVLHGGINLLTQGSAGTLWPVARCLAFCQPTNPLTRPEHALLTTAPPAPPQSVGHSRLTAGPRPYGLRPRPCPRHGVLSWPRRAEALGGTQGASGLSRGRGSSHPCPAPPCHPGLHFSSLIPLSLLTFRDPVSSWKPASLPTPTLRALLVLGPGFLCLQGTVALPCGLPEPSAPGQAIVSPN